MTPQSTFMVLAAIRPEREVELRQLLASMNDAPGRVNPNNSLVPFAQFDTLHVARFVILDDATTEDIRIYGLQPRTYPLQLAFLGDIDGEEQDFLNELAERAPNGLRAIFACCEGFSADDDLVEWMTQHRRPAIANYINTRGRTVRQVREEAALTNAVQSYLASKTGLLRNRSAREVHETLRRFVKDETTAGRLALSEEPATNTKWWIANKLHLIGVPLLFLLASPFLIVAAPFYLLRLRHLEKTDSEICQAVDQKHSEDLSLLEDHDVTNQFSAMGSLKPGLLRLLTTAGVLTLVNYGARHLVRPGRLGRIRSIHFARWVFLDGRKRMIFCSNYDGSVESYMDDFINKTGFGLNASFSNGIGYPRTNWLVLDGCADERKYKEYLRRHTIATQVWYKAYPGLTAIDLERNTRIRRGIESPSMSEQKLGEWIALL